MNYVVDYGTSRTYNYVMEFIETPIFTKIVNKYLNDTEYFALQLELMNHPEKGVLIPGSGGLRKIRWSSKGRGKSGGVRIIYYYKCDDYQIWLLTIYAKNEIENISLKLLKSIKEELKL